jgi:hypothetical protein
MHGRHGFDRPFGRARPESFPCPMEALLFKCRQAGHDLLVRNGLELPVPVRGDTMSVSGISSSSLIDSSNQSVHNNMRQFQQEFQQLGIDLQNGTLSAANPGLFHTARTCGAGQSTSSSTSSSSPHRANVQTAWAGSVPGMVRMSDVKSLFSNVTLRCSRRPRPRGKSSADTSP